MLNGNAAGIASDVPSGRFEDLMLAEHTHRMANDLASVIAELELCRARAVDDVAASALSVAVSRLRDVHGVQRCLMPPVGGDVDLRGVIGNLASAVVRAHARGATIALDLDLISLVVDSQFAWRLATIVNELLTNALKYGTRMQSGRITVSLVAQRGWVTCAVRDDGGGAGDWVARVVPFQVGS